MANDELYNELRRLAKMANQRILRLEREFGSDIAPIKKLRNRLDSSLVRGWTQGGRVRYNKSMTEEQMRASIKALEDFKASIQSRVSGYRKVREFRREQIKRVFEVDDEDVDKFFDILEDAKSRILDKIDPSKFFAMVQEAKDINATFERWISILEQEIEIGNDVDLRKDALYLYNKYVLG